MGSSAPYLQRRGGGFTFRIAVPAELRHQLGVREITKALPSSSSRQEAVALALSLAHQAKHLFLQLRRTMSKSKTASPPALDFGYTLELDLDDLGLPKRVKVQAEPHEEDAVNAALRTVLLSRGRSVAPAINSTEVSAPPQAEPLVTTATTTTANESCDGRRTVRQPPMLSLWGSGLVLNSLSYPVFGLRAWGWTDLSIVLTNLLTSLTLVLHTQAIASFQRERVQTLSQ